MNCDRTSYLPMLRNVELLKLARSTIMIFVLILLILNSILLLSYSSLLSNSINSSELLARIAVICITQI